MDFIEIHTDYIGSLINYLLLGVASRYVLVFKASGLKKLLELTKYLIGIKTLYGRQDAGFTPT